MRSHTVSSRPRPSHDHPMPAGARAASLAWVILALTLALLAPVSASAAEILLYHADGSPAWIQGELGSVALPPIPEEPTEAYYEEAYLALHDGLQAALAEHFGTTGEEGLDFVSMAVSQSQGVNVGNLAFTQTMSGLPVVDSGFRARVDLDAGQIVALHGRVYPWRSSYDLRNLSQMSFEDALARTLTELEAEAELLDDPQLVFVGGQAELVLAYRVLASLSTSTDGAPEYLTIAATDGRFLGAEPTQLTGPPPGPGTSGGWWPTITSTQKFRSHNGSAISSLPPYGPLLLCSTNIHFPIPGFLSVPTSACTPDDSVARAHDHAIKVYRFFREKQGWKSYDGNGSPLVSVANELVKNQAGQWVPMVNAYWDSLKKEMHYGDGDGYILYDTTLGFDVAAHELSHGITKARNGLVYNKEPGALNEAFSDIFAAAAEAWKDGGITADTFLIGEDVAGPALGQALRYMYNPALDGQSPGYYPDRLYPDPNCFPTGGPGGNDYCGVHHNSGIANLAFYLLVSGGQHPQGKTTVQVPAIGMDKARAIFFEAHGMLSPLSNFHAVRLATEQAAATLYDAATAAAVSDCWTAVGVDP